MERTAQTMRQNFISKPNDQYIVPVFRNCLSSGMSFRVLNTNEDFSISCDNKLEVWELLRKLDDMGGRSVFVQYDNEQPIPYKESAPYKHRFC